MPNTMMPWGCASAAGLGQGLTNWWCSLCSLLGALGVSPKFRALPLSLSGTKICPARDSFQRPLAASPGSWLFLKRQAVVAKAIWKQKWCSGALMLPEGVSARGCPRCGWGRLCTGGSPLEGDAGRLVGSTPLSFPLSPVSEHRSVPGKILEKLNSQRFFGYTLRIMQGSVPFPRAPHIAVA